MKTIILILLVIVVLALTLNKTTEKYQELFGFVGYQKPVNQVVLDDAKFDTSGYEEVETVVNHDLMEKLVLATNKEITKRTDDCSYIIETTAVKKYSKDGQDVYKCMFMCVRAKGFAFGFSVVATLSVKGDDVKVLSLRTQPMDVQEPSDVSPYVQDVAKEFVDFEIVKAKAVPTTSELEEAKEKLKQM
jgi:hypothetical protein